MRRRDRVLVERLRLVDFGGAVHRYARLDGVLRLLALLDDEPVLVHRADVAVAELGPAEREQRLLVRAGGGGVGDVRTFEQRCQLPEVGDVVGERPEFVEIDRAGAGEVGEVAIGRSAAAAGVGDKHLDGAQALAPAVAEQGADLLEEGVVREDRGGAAFVGRTGAIGDGSRAPERLDVHPTLLDQGRVGFGGRELPRREVARSGRGVLLRALAVDRRRVRVRRLRVARLRVGRGITGLLPVGGGRRLLAALRIPVAHALLALLGGLLRRGLL